MNAYLKSKILESVSKITLIDILKKNAHDSSISQNGVIFIDENGNEVIETYENLYKNSLKICHNLKKRGIKKNDFLIMQVTDELHFIRIFWGCILGGIIPIPLPVPITFSLGTEAFEKLLRVNEELSSPFIVIDEKIANLLKKDYEKNNLKHIVYEELLNKVDDFAELNSIEEEDIAYIQYSSGSTGEPKGVPLTHKNIICNVNQISRGFELNEVDFMGCWSPLTHDMGLVGFYLTAVYGGINVLRLSPEIFIKDPNLFLEKVQQHGVTIFPSPNFGLALMIDKINNSNLEKLDLSRVRLIINGAEPISSEIVRQFYDKFKKVGLSDNAIFQAYGLAEATVAVTMPRVGEATKSIVIDRSCNMIGKNIKEISKDNLNASEFALLGRPVDGMEIQILDEDLNLLEEEQIGNIFIKGPNVFKGYFLREGAFFTKEGFFETGDLGFVKSGNLVITGRKKNIIFIHGQNYYAEDIERIIKSEYSNKLEGIAVASYFNNDKGKDDVVVFIEFEENLKKFISIHNKFQEILFKSVGFFADLVIPIKNIPKTTSGKPQRYKLVDMLSNNKFDSIIYEIKNLLKKAQSGRSVSISKNNEGIKNRVLDIAKRILKTDDVNINDSLFSLGFDSIKLISFLSEIKNEFNIDIQMTDFIIIGDLNQLANYIIESQSKNIFNGYKYDQLQSNPINLHEPFDLTEVQMAYLMGRQGAFEMGGVSTHAYYEFQTELDIGRFNDALNKVINRHPMLRSIVYENGKQQILKKVPHYQVDVLDLRNTSEHERNIMISNERKRMSHFVFKSDTWPLFEFKAFRLSEKEHYIFSGFDLLIADGSSLRIFMKEILEYYKQPDICLPELDFSFADYMRGYEKLKESDIYERDSVYWKKKAKDFPAAPQLPLIKKPEYIEKPKFERIHKVYSKESKQRLKTIAMEQKVTLSALLFTAYSEVLAKWSNQPQMAINLTVFNRYPFNKDVMNIIGDFTSTLLIDIDLNYTTNFWERARKIQSSLLDSLEHRHYSGVDFIRDIVSYKGINGKAVAPIVFTSMLFDDAEESALEFDKEGIEFRYGISQTPQVYLDFQVMDIDNKLSINWDYVSDIFDKSMIENMFNAYLNKLEVIMDTTIDVTMLPREELQFIEKYNSTKSDINPELLHKMIDAQVKKTPNAIAVKSENEEISYKELGIRSNQIARYLTKKGFGRGDFIGVLTERRIETIVNIVGILKSGCAYVPIDPSYPEERKKYILEKSKCRAFLTPELYDEEEIKFYDSSPVDYLNQLQDTAYVIYTSGSTGKPKGVVITHQGVSNTIIDINKRFSVGEGDKIIGLSSMCFDLSVYDIFGSLTSGAQLVMVRDLLDVSHIKQIVEEECITIWNSVPAIMEMMVDNITNTSFEPDYWNVSKNYEASMNFNDKLRLVMLSGDWINLGLPKKINENFPCAEVISLGGATEASIWSIYYPIDDLDETWSSIPYGYPLSNQTIHILDFQMEECPIGTMGELYIGGIGVAAYYLNEPEKTKNSFINHPTLGYVYKTGDYGVLRHNGYVEFMGRKDHQVKIRGYRIELGEIENCLLQIPEVKNTVVIDRIDNQGKKYLCGYIIEEQDIDIGDLKEYLKTRLPNYMVPSMYVKLSKIPLTANGKVDKKRLPEPEIGEKLAKEIVYPRNEIENKLLDIWRLLLNVDEISVEDNFFELGGDSLKGALLVSKVSKEFNAEIPLREVFKNPTICEISKYLERTKQNSSEEIKPIGKKEYYEVSSSQKRMYILDKIENKSLSYNASVALKIDGKIDKDYLQEVVDKLVQRHEAFRTCFKMINGEVVQLIKDTVEIKIEFYDIQEIEENKEEKAKEIIKQFIRLFDLSVAPLLRVGLIQLDENMHILMLDTHHIISDGTTKEIIIREFSDIFNKKQLEDLRIQYKDFANWQNERLASGKLRKEEEYWLNEFKDEIPVLNLFTDYPRTAVRSFEGSQVSIEIDNYIVEKIQEIKAKTGTTSYMILLSTINVLLMKYTGQEDIVIGSPIAGRSSHSDMNNIVGVFVNTLAIRNQPIVSKKFKDFLLEVKEKVLQGFENQEYPFEELVNKLQLKRDISRNPLFDILFAFQNMEGNVMNMEGVNVSPYELENEISKFDISIYGHEVGNKLKFEFEYCTKLYKRESIERLALAFKGVLEQVSQNPELQIQGIDVIGLKEREKVLNEFNNTSFKYQRDKIIPELFEERVSRKNDSVALIFDENKISYKELNSRSNQLARILRQKGVQPNDIVGVMVERSVEMIVGILAILKAGGAYLPIDPNYPEERVSFMIEDSEAKIILTQDKYKNKTGKQIDQIDIMKQDLYVGEDSNLEKMSKSTDLAYVIYTSGSTGKPKGVMIEHCSAHNFIIGVCDRIEFIENSRILSVTTISFDIFFLETLLPLCMGLEVVIANELEQRDPKLLRQLIKKEKVEMIQMTPSMIQMQLTKYESEYYKSVKTLMIGGEALSSKLLENILKSGQFKVYNMYGPTETTIWSTICELKNPNEISIGKPILNTRIYILDKNLKICPVGVVGELYIGGDGLARGYLNRPELSREKFIENPYRPGENIYCTGDLSLWLPNGNIEYLGRSDTQVKVSGHRMELGEIENKILEIDGIREAVVTVRENKYKEKYLCAYLVSEHKKTTAELRIILKSSLPEYMIPNYFVNMKEFPLTPNGKIDRKLLPEPLSNELNNSKNVDARNEVEDKLIKTWREVLGRKDIGIDDNFFELGGTSLSIVRLSSSLSEELNQNIEAVTLFQYPTIRSLEEYLIGESEIKGRKIERNKYLNNSKNRDIAIIGMAGRFPKSNNINEMWENLRNSKELISYFDKEELLGLGVKKEILDDDNYVPAAAVLEDIEYFDAEFFEYTPRDAQIMDPQIRIFEECAWEALEDAGYNPEKYDGDIGLFAGASTNFDWQYSTFNKAVDGFSDVFNTMNLNDSKCLPTQVSYKLNLKGPSVYVNTACSTSLVSIHMACQSIINGECSMAMAGGINATQTLKLGYFFEEGMIMSPDGHCCAFDEQASGTVFGNGVGIVVLKPLEEAINDKDHIYAVIKGSAINNDGNTKAGFTAPSVEGQKDVIKKALSVSGVNPESISYIETHGTGTPLGDPIEIEALKQAYSTNKKGYCAIGSIKTNMGHLDVASGVAGFIKTALALKNKEIPASLNYNKPNPKIDFDNSPFYVNSKLRKWNTDDSNPLRAGVSSFGIGGTNAHLILEEAPVVDVERSINKYNILTISAKTETALKNMEQKLAEYLKKQENINLQDVAYTLVTGRKEFKYRSAIVCKEKQDAIEMLLKDSKKRKTAATEERKAIVFMFPGQGNQYINMGKDLYENEEVFRQNMDYCFDVVKAECGYDIKTILYGEDRIKVNETEIAQLSIYIFEYSLAMLLQSWGIEPEVMIGHSIGEYVAATLAEVITLEDCLKLISIRGKLMQAMPRGVMLSVMLSEDQADKLINEDMSVEIAVVNSSNMCVLSGTEEEIEKIEHKLENLEVEYVRLKTSHAYHSKMMQGAATEYRDFIKSVKLNVPKKKYVSNLTGDFINEEEAIDPEYWVNHMLNTVKFEQGVKKLLNNSRYVLIEVGPGKALSTLVKAHKEYNNDQIVENLVKHAKDVVDDNLYLMRKLSMIWMAGVSVNWEEYYKEYNARRISLPTYSFDRKRYWIDDSDAKLMNLIIPQTRELKLEDTSIKSKEISENDESYENIDSNRPELTTEYIKSSNDLEQMLVDLTEEILGINKIGIKDNFFELGADSLKCAMLSRKIHRKMKVEIPINEIFIHPTVEGISKYIKDIKKTFYNQIEKLDTKQYYEVSSSQKRMYILSKMDENGISYNIPDALEIVGKLDRNRVKKAINSLIQRHESLRTSFEMIEGEIVQKVADEAEIQILYYDLIKEENVKEEKINEIKEHFVQPFDLNEAPLFRVGIIQVEEEKNILIFDLHHIVCDGISMRVIIKDFVKAYSEEESTELKLQYKDFAAWQNKMINSEALKLQEEYWIKQFEKGVPILNLPTDYERPKVQSFEGDQIYFELDKDIKKGLEKLAQETETTMYMIQLAAFNILLSRCCGDESIVIGSPIAVRHHGDLENIVGMFMNTLPMKNFPEGNKTVEEFIREVKINALNAYRNQDYPLDELIEKIKLDKDKSRNPLFDVMLIQQSRDIRNEEISELTISPYRLKKKSTMVDISMYLYEEYEKLTLVMEFCTKLYKRETAERMINDYVKVLEIIANDSSILIKNINFDTDVKLLDEVAIDVEFNL